MTFIIALGVIVILLCTASVFRLMQPRQEEKTTAKQTKPKKEKKPKKVKAKKAPTKPTAPVAPSLHQKPVDTPTPRIATALAPAPVPEAIVIYLRAPAEKQYCGYELLQALLTAGMRFGKMNIFHRHEKKTGVGPVLFSLASAESPGTFDLAKIGGFYSKALTLFLQPAEVADPAKAYEMMLDTADQLVEDLGGTVLDEKRALLKKEAVLSIHQKLRAYMQDKQSLDLFT